MVSRKPLKAIENPEVNLFLTLILEERAPDLREHGRWLRQQHLYKAISQDCPLFSQKPYYRPAQRKLRILPRRFTRTSRSGAIGRDTIGLGPVHTPPVGRSSIQPSVKQTSEVGEPVSAAVEPIPIFAQRQPILYEDERNANPSPETKTTTLTRRLPEV